ncbi:MAG: hypothetical protein WDM70_01985 [Nitrosomonadales bacterium]
MDENNSIAGDATPEKLTAVAGTDCGAELSGVQDILDRIMSSGDDKTKKQIFNRVICQLAGALPDLPPEALAKEPKPISVGTRNLFDASDKLREAAYLAEFIQSISLIVPHDEAVLLQPGQLTGFYYAMQNTIDRIKEAEVLIDAARTQPEALPA